MGTNKRSLEELRSKAFDALIDPHAAWVVRTSSTPTAAYQRADVECAPRARACRFGAILRRDYGEEAFEKAVCEENFRTAAHDPTTQEGVQALECLSNADQAKAVAQWERERGPSNQDLLDLLRIGRFSVRLEELRASVIEKLQDRRPEVDQCIDAVTSGNPFAEVAWGLLKEYDDGNDVLQEALPAIAAGRSTPPEILAEVEQLLDDAMAATGWKRE